MKRQISEESTTMGFRLPSIVSLGKERSSYSMPKEICHFSYDGNRQLLLSSKEALSKYSPQSLPYNLYHGYPDDYIQRDDVEEYLDALLKSIQAEKLEKKPSFVTWRGIMTLLVCTPYQQREDWELKASLVDGTIYLMQVKEPSVQKDQQVNTYYGYKFEACFTCPVDKPATDKPIVNTNIQYCSVFHAKLSKHNLILGGEVDCIYHKQYCELKTHKEIENERMDISFRKYKLLKTYIQSYLAGVVYIIFGFKKDQEIVGLKEYKTDQIPGICAEYWNRHVCFNFGSMVLDFIAENVTIDDRKTR
ncbi:Dom-3 Z [Boothiomyces sp. JEL0866]|nr:Dom-3 Z [Boothiomyces sp. JEL0866]